MAYESLFKPIKIKGVEIPNRFGMAPMNINFTREGYISEQHMAYFGARAKGGTGLIITEAVRTSEEGTNRTFYDNPHMWKPAHQKGLAELCETVHYFGGKLFAQMNIGPGPQGSSKKTGLQPRAASARPFTVAKEMVPKQMLPWMERGEVYISFKGEMPREMTKDEIKKEVEQFAKSANMAFVAGVDGVEIHAAHGYLLHSFLSPLFNLRKDEYGGSPENRLRFLMEVVKAAREMCGSKAIIGVRASSNEQMPGGLTLEDSKIMVKALEKAGMDFFHLSGGSYEAMKYLFPDEDGTMMEDGKALTQTVKIPIIISSCHDPDLVDKAVREGYCDIMALGRPLIADPDYANKVKEGRTKDIVKCKRDLMCLVRLFQGLPGRCTVNPNFGRERYMQEYWRGPTKAMHWRRVG